MIPGTMRMRLRHARNSPASNPPRADHEALRAVRTFVEPPQGRAKLRAASSSRWIRVASRGVEGECNREVQLLTAPRTLFYGTRKHVTTFAQKQNAMLAQLPRRIDDSLKRCRHLPLISDFGFEDTLNTTISESYIYAVVMVGENRNGGMLSDFLAEPGSH